MDADFIVIGGGIAGISAAARLSGMGRVLLLEAEAALGYHTSGRSAALYEANYGAPATVALTKASFGWLQDAGVLRPRGFMVVAGPGEEDAFAADLDELCLSPITAAAAQEMVPILDTARITGAAYGADALDIDTDSMLQRFAREARAAGATFRTSAAVEALDRDARGWRVRAGGEDHGAPVVVNAAGAWADRVAQMAGLSPLGIVPYRRSIAQLSAPGGHDLANWPMFMGAGEGWYAKPEAGRLLVSPAEEDPVEPHDAWADDMVLAEGLARYEAAVTVPVTRVEKSWAGLRSFSPDRALVIGEEPSAPGFFWLAGQGGQGMQSAAGASVHLADCVAGRPPAVGAAIARAVSPARFRDGA